MFKALRLAISFLCAYGLLLFPSAAATKTAFPVGQEYTFYCFSTSSQAEIVTCPPAFAAVYKYVLLDCLTGESTVYDSGERDADGIIEEYGAQVKFCECLTDSMNYYCYSPALGEGVTLNGYEINLHIAQKKSQTAVGTPLIFGGF